MRKILITMACLIAGLVLSATPQKRQPTKSQAASGGISFRSTAYGDQVRSDLELRGSVEPFDVDVVAATLPEAMDGLQQQLATSMGLLGLVPMSRQEVAKARRVPSLGNPVVLVGGDEIVFRPKDGTVSENLLKRVVFIGDRSLGDYSGKLLGLLVTFQVEDPNYVDGRVTAHLQVGLKGILMGGYGDGRKATSPLMDSNMNSHDLRSLVSAVAQGESPETALVDANDFLSVPQNFDGVVLQAGAEAKVLFTFHGDWRPSTTIEGATAALYSKKAARLKAVFSDDGSSYKLGFNFGMRRGVPKFRAFTWPGEGEPANLMDEGPVSRDGGIFKLSGKRYTVIFRSAKAPWNPTSVLTGRFEGRAFQYENSLRAGRPYGRDTEYQASQYTPEWAAGSYLHVTDGFLGKYFFRLFGGKTIVAVPTVMLDGKFQFGDPVYVGNGGRVVDEFRPLFSRGMAFYRTAVGGPKTVEMIFPRIGADLAVESVRFGGSNLGVRSILNGVSTTVEFAEEATFLAAAKTNHGLFRALPGALSASFKGCVFYAPWPAFYADMEGPAKETANHETREAYQGACIGWKTAVQLVGGTFVPVEPSKWAERPMVMDGVGRIGLP